MSWWICIRVQSLEIYGRKNGKKGTMYHTNIIRKGISQVEGGLFEFTLYIRPRKVDVIDLIAVNVVKEADSVAQHAKRSVKEHLAMTIRNFMPLFPGLIAEACIVPLAPARMIISETRIALPSGSPHDPCMPSLEEGRRGDRSYRHQAKGVAHQRRRSKAERTRGMGGRI